MDLVSEQMFARYISLMLPASFPATPAGAPPWRPWISLALAHFGYVKTYSVCNIILICLYLSYKKLILRMASSGNEF